MSDKSNKIDFSLVVPCYMESGHLEKSIAQLSEVLSECKFTWEIIFVDDGSLDNTPAIIHRCSATIPNCQIILKSKNEGRGRAVQDGVGRARGTVVGFVDIDLEVAAHYIPVMVSTILIKEAEVVTGCRAIQWTWSPYGIVRLCLSQGYRFLFRCFLGLPISDPETGFKFFNRESLNEILPSIKNRGWFWDSEVMAKSYLSGLRIRELPCVFIRRQDKKSTVRLLRDTLRQFRELVSFARALEISGKPLEPLGV